MSITAAPIWCEVKRLQGLERLTFDVARQRGDASAEQAPSGVTLAAMGALEGAVSETLLDAKTVATA